MKQIWVSIKICGGCQKKGGRGYMKKIKICAGGVDKTMWGDGSTNLSIPHPLKMSNGIAQSGYSRVAKGVPTTALVECYSRLLDTYCRVPAGWGLCRTALAPDSDETRSVNPLVRTQVDVCKTLTKRIQTNKLLK